jgi:hypothetical protein
MRILDVRSFGLVASVVLLGCGAQEAEEEGGYDPRVITIQVDHDVVGEEAFGCQRFNRPELAGKKIRGFHWKPPEDTSIQLHHAVTFGLFNLAPNNNEECDGDSEVSHQIHVYTVGGDLFELPPGTAYQLPNDLDRIDIDTHVLRLVKGPPQTATLTLDLADEPVENTISTFKVKLPVPTIPPHETVTTVRLCRIEGTARLVGVWPHMHTVGKEFRGAVIRATGERETFIHLDPWNFTNQITHPIDVEVHAGDKIETMCVWSNPTAETIFGGSRTDQEMCQQMLFAYPPEAAHCTIE